MPLDKPNNALGAALRARRPEPDLGEGAPAASPLLLYAWETTWPRWGRCATPTVISTTASPSSTRTRRPGRSILPTMACWIQMLRPGERLKAHRHTGSAVYYVVQGEGETIIDGCRFVWGKGDIVALPSWALHEHANPSHRVSRRPLLDPGSARPGSSRPVSRRGSRGEPGPPGGDLGLPLVGPP